MHKPNHFQRAYIWRFWYFDAYCVSGVNVHGMKWAKNANIWHLRHIRILKPPYVSSLKMVGFVHFSNFLIPSEKDYNLQSCWISLYLGHILCIFIAYLRHIFGISWVYLGQILVVVTIGCRDQLSRFFVKIGCQDCSYFITYCILCVNFWHFCNIPCLLQLVVNHMQKMQNIQNMQNMQFG